MAVIVEDGSGVVGANSYIAVADADTYFANVNNTTWDGLDPIDEKAPFLVLAQQYMAQAFRLRWLGYRATNTQVLDWPRLWVNRPDAPGNYGPYPLFYGPTDIPQQLKDGQCLLAVKLASGDALAPDVERVTLSEAVGSIKVTYNPNATPVTIYRDVELIFAPFFKSTGMNIQLGRA